MSDHIDALRKQGPRQNVFSRLDPPVNLDEAITLAEEFDLWEADVLTLRLCHPHAFMVWQTLIRTN